MVNNFGMIFSIIFNYLALKHHMADAIYIIQQTFDKQRLSIDNLRSEVLDVKTNLNCLIGSVDLLKTAGMTSADSNIILNIDLTITV